MNLSVVVSAERHVDDGKELTASVPEGEVVILNWHID